MARVLVVDDLIFMRMMLKDILDQHGFDLAGEARNGLEAVTQFEALQPDLVLLDITMPHLDGIGALKEIMAIDPQAKVVMCSAISEHRMIVKAVQLGARDYVVKPFRPERVVSAINKALGKAGGLV
jgi:two-component system, chemotaxis family, chemotaxis protein CheY